MKTETLPNINLTDKPDSIHLDAFKTLFEKSHDGVLLIDNGVFTDCNESIVRMLGYTTKEEVLELHPGQLRETGDQHRNS